MQLVAPALLTYKPAEQLVHDPAPAAEYLPIAQAVQPLELAAAYWPAAHAPDAVETDMRQRFRAERLGYDTVAERKRELGRARVSDFKDATSDQVSVGSVVDVTVTSTGKRARFTVLGAWDSEPEKNIIAYKTPLGLALLGKKTGDTVSVKIGGAEESYTIAAIARHAE